MFEEFVKNTFIRETIVPPCPSAMYPNKSCFRCLTGVTLGYVNTLTEAVQRDEQRYNVGLAVNFNSIP